MAKATPVTQGENLNEALAGVSPEVVAAITAQVRAELGVQTQPEVPAAASIYMTDKGVKLESHDAVRKDN